MDVSILKEASAGKNTVVGTNARAHIMPLAGSAVTAQPLSTAAITRNNGKALILGPELPYLIYNEETQSSYTMGRILEQGALQGNGLPLIFSSRHQSGQRSSHWAQDGCEVPNGIGAWCCLSEVGTSTFSLWQNVAIKKCGLELEQFCQAVDSSLHYA